MTSKKLRIIGILNVNDTGAIMSPVIREKRLNTQHSLRGGTRVSGYQTCEKSGGFRVKKPNKHNMMG